MKFPMIGDITSTNVVSVDLDTSIATAIELMLDSEHRNIIVEEEGSFYIFTVMDVLILRASNKALETRLGDLSLTKTNVIKKNKNILDTLEFLNSNVEHICVTNEDGSLYGVITHTDITSSIDPDTLMENYRLKDFIKLGRRMKWVCKDEITATLIEDMIKHQYDNVIVVEGMSPVGILTTKDIMHLIKNKRDLSLSVKNYMSSPVNTIGKDSSVKDALGFIKDKHYKRVIVVDENGQLSGVISQKELISLTYSRWAVLMKEYQLELNEINSILQSKNREYETMASTDSLTGLYNRYKFSELYLSSYTSMVQRHNEMSLIMLDIDFFKKVNDTYGHNIGDQVLIQISHVLLRTLRNIDIVCRWGGEEFMVLLPTASLSQASHLAEKLRSDIESLELDVVGSVTASFGVSLVREGESMQDAIERADKALYLAKKSGRNCVQTELDI